MAALQALSLSQSDPQAFSEQLEAFLRSRSYLHAVGNESEDDDPAKYFMSFVWMMDTGSEILIDHTKAVSDIANAVIVASSCAPGLTGSEEGVMLQCIYKIGATLAPAAKEWAASKRKKYDKKEMTRRVKDAASKQELLDRKARSICTRISGLATTESASSEDLATAIVALQLLLQATSLSAAMASELVSNKEILKTSAWATGAAAGAVGLVCCLAIPVIPVVGGSAVIGSAFYGMLAGAATSTGVTVGGVVKAVESGIRRTNSKSEIKLAFESIDNNVKALVGFLGYLWRHEVLLHGPNNERYRERVRAFDKKLSMDPSQWLKKAYIQDYIKEASRELGISMEDWNNHLLLIGVSVDPLSIGQG